MVRWGEDDDGDAIALPNSYKYRKLYLNQNNIKRCRPSSHMLTDTESRLVKRWLTLCVDYHEKCTVSQLKPDFGEDARILLIDTKRLCLVKALTSYRYLALSYVWGGVSQLLATRNDLEALLKPRSLFTRWDQIPRVVRDAIDFTDRIGELFLWVDALCIVQDDATSKHQQLHLMSDIYNCATATLIACIGENADCALLPAATPALPGANGLFSSDTIKRHDNPRELLNAISHSHYSSRGWTYQERLLSRRRIVFLPTGVVFHCRSDMFSSHGRVKVSRTKRLIHNPDTTRGRVMDEFDDSISVDEHEDLFYQDRSNGQGRNAAKLVAMLAPLEKTISGQHNGLEWPELHPRAWERGHKFWVRVIEEYSRTTFSYDSDVLHACTGILVAFSQSSNWEAVQGNVIPFLELSLLWIPKSQVVRRKCLEDTGYTPSFPSWSWTGWKGEITYKMSRLNGRIKDFESRLKQLTFGEGGYPFDQSVLRGKRSLVSQEPSVLRSTILGSEWVDGEDPNTLFDEQKFPALEKQSRLGCEDILGASLRFRAFLAPVSAFLWSSPDTMNMERTRLRTKVVVSPSSSKNEVSRNKGAWIRPSRSARSGAKLNSFETEQYTSTNQTTESLSDCIAHGVWIQTKQEMTCGMIYGVDPKESARLVTGSFRNLDLILLSDARQSGLGLENRLKHYRYPPIGFGTPTAASGTIKNIMLIRWVGGRAERVGVGEIIARDWESARPEEKDIVLF